MGTANNIEQFRFAPSAVFDPQRFESSDLGIALSPSFQVGRDDRIFVMGSCFSVRICEALCELGFDASDGGLELKYNAFAMLQEARWCLEGGFGAAQVLRTPDGRWFNPHRHPATVRASRAEALDAHLAAQVAARERLRSASVLVLTYGLIEAWFDRATGLYTNETPALAELPHARERFELRQTRHAENVTAILELVRLVRRANPSLRIVASVSPIPLKATFCGPDVLVSNCASKSTLRAALHEAIVELAREGVAIDYFPSYEIVSLAPRRDDVWEPRFPDGRPDGRHVKPAFVSRAITSLFLRTYVEPSLVRAGARPRVQQELLFDGCATR
jgi:hypothetical protein